MQRADQRQFHYIYKITRDDGRYYIGLHSTDNLDDGYFGSGKLITRSIKKHGKERHTKEILEYLLSRQAVKDREKEMLTEELRADPMCMNIAPGGGGGFINEEHHRKASSNGGKVSGIKNIAQARTNFTEQSMQKSLATRARNGHLFTTQGLKFSDEAKDRMSKAGTGEKNSQFGTCWVTNGTPVKIKKEQLDEYLQNGYVRGRKL